MTYQKFYKGTWRAFPTNCATPVTMEEAERVAEEHLYTDVNRTRGDVLNIEEYEACFAVQNWPKPQQDPDFDPAAPPRPPEPGQSVVVLDKETGGVTFWPSLPTFVVADAYKNAKLAGDVVLLDEWPRAEEG